MNLSTASFVEADGLMAVRRSYDAEWRAKHR
jgi:hypothetical protein